VNIEQQLLEVTEVLRYPVLIAAILCLAFALVDAGKLIGEVWQRRRRSVEAIDTAVAGALAALERGDWHGGAQFLRASAWDRPMGEAMAALVTTRMQADAEQRIAKRMAEYDYRSLRRLERSRILVRMGPALGLMGTLIPLSPALSGLANGNVVALTENLSVAFSVTVAGLLVGAIAFGTSLIRDRLYAQDYSDVEYAESLLAPRLGGPTTQSPTMAAASLDAAHVSGSAPTVTVGSTP
jgi:biopolymer transport protein ExbB/TolQ